MSWIIGAVIGGIIGFIIAVNLIPNALSVIGFSTASVVAGSVAAGIQSTIGNVVAGSLFATLQSIGAVGGLSWIATTITTGFAAIIGVITGRNTTET